MSALTIATLLQIPISAETLKARRVDIGGGVNRAFDGTARLHRRASKWEFDFETPALSAEEAHAWEGLFKGLGHYWSFDSNLYSSKGLGPNAGATAARATSNPLAGAGNLEFTGSDTITYAANLGDAWTVSLWRDASGAPGGAAYVHYVVRSDGAKWVDGVRNDAASTGFISVSSGSLTLADTDTDMDSIHACPFLWHESWPSQIYLAAGQDIIPLPSLYVIGDAVPGSSANAVLFLGEVVDKTYYGGRASGGSFSDTVQSLSVRLVEV